MRRLLFALIVVVFVSTVVFIYWGVRHSAINTMAMAEIRNSEIVRQAIGHSIAQDWFMTGKWYYESSRSVCFVTGSVTGSKGTLRYQARGFKRGGDWVLHWVALDGDNNEDIMIKVSNE